jgi:hypothetical protein
LGCHVVVSHGLLPAPGAASTWPQRGRRHSHINVRGVVPCFRTRLIGRVDWEQDSTKKDAPKTVFMLEKTSKKTSKFFLILISNHFYLELQNCTAFPLAATKCWETEIVTPCSLWIGTTRFVDWHWLAGHRVQWVNQVSFIEEANHVKPQHGNPMIWCSGALVELSRSIKGPATNYFKISRAFINSHGPSTKWLSNFPTKCMCLTLIHAPSTLVVERSH